MTISGIPFQYHNLESKNFVREPLSQKIEQDRSAVKKKDWQEDRLARQRLEDWIFAVR